MPTTPADRAGACVDCFPARTAFPKWQEGRHPHCHSHSLLRLHSRYGPSDCSAALQRPLSRGSGPSGCPAKPLVSDQINRQLSGWNPPPLVIRAFGAHCQLQTIGRTANCPLMSTRTPSALSSSGVYTQQATMISLLKAPRGRQSAEPRNFVHEVTHRERIAIQMKGGNASWSPSAVSDQDDSGTDRQRDKDGNTDPFDQSTPPSRFPAVSRGTSSSC